MDKHYDSLRDCSPAQPVPCGCVINSRGREGIRDCGKVRYVEVDITENKIAQQISIRSCRVSHMIEHVNIQLIEKVQWWQGNACWVVGLKCYPTQETYRWVGGCWYVELVTRWWRAAWYYIVKRNTNHNPLPIVLKLE